MQQSSFPSTNPYGDISNNTRRSYFYSAEFTKAPKYNNYNATYSRATVSQIVDSSTPTSRETIKNTIKYTDWFGSVVAKKSPSRPSLPLFQSAAALPGEVNPPAVISWDNYMSIRSRQPIAVEIPLSLQGYGNFCACPDQLFGTTKGKKKKKCKKCGRKFATVTKHATAIGSVTRVRPAIPPTFYQAPSPASWAWPQPTKNQYNQYMTPAIETRKVESPPHTPETIRSSSSSSNTLTPENSSLVKALPPPPTVPLPLLPSNNSDKDGKKSSILSSPNSSAYELLEKECLVNSDTDELSDNAVGDSWCENKINNSKNCNNGHQISVIAVGSKEDKDEHKVRIYTNNPERNKTSTPKKNFSEVREVSKPVTNSSNALKVNNNVSTFKYNWDSPISSMCKADSSSSHLKQKTKNKRNVSGIPERDSSKLVNIAGQRILFDQKILSRSYDQKQILEKNKENIPVTGEWESLREESLTEKVPDLMTFSDDEETSVFCGKELPNNYRNKEKAWKVTSSDTIQEEEEEELEEENELITETSQSNELMEEFEQDNEDKDTTSSSSLESPPRSEGFQPTLSELLQVKSILKRPNSLDTSSETDSDFYLPTFSEYKKNLRKKKSVQFRQSNDVTLVEVETKGRKVNSIKNRREKKKLELNKNDSEKECQEKFNYSWDDVNNKKLEYTNLSEDINEPQEQCDKGSDELINAIHKQFPELESIEMTPTAEYDKSIHLKSKTVESNRKYYCTYYFIYLNYTSYYT